MQISERLLTILLVAAMTILNVVVIGNFWILRGFALPILLICYGYMGFRQWKRSKQTAEDAKYLGILYLTYFALTVTLMVNYRFSIIAFIVLFFWYLYTVDAVDEVDEFEPTERTPNNQQMPDDSFSDVINDSAV
jgi:hypothetical protein